MAKQYAYGDWEVDGVECPVRAAGLEGHPFDVEVAEEYDEFINGVGDYEDEGVVDEDVAREAFDTMIAWLKDSYRNSEDGVYSEELELAQEVADKLGWSYKTV